MQSRNVFLSTLLTLGRCSRNVARYQRLPNGQLLADRHLFTRRHTNFGPLRQRTLKIRNSNHHWIYTTVFAVCISTYLLERPTTLLEAPQQYSPDNNESFRRDPSTSQPFPILLPNPISALPTSCGQLYLIGLGVRTVSFLRVKVYSSALYIDSNALKNLDEVEGWKGFEKTWFMDSNSNHNAEKLISALLDQGITFVIRIVPVRSTDYNHLRDGFTRSIQGRAKLARKKGELTDTSDEALSNSLQALKDAFPRASLPKGQALDLLFIPSRSGRGHDLFIEESGKVLGQVKSPEGLSESRYSVARQLLLAYMANKDEISRPFKESVAEGFVKITREG